MKRDFLFAPPRELPVDPEKMPLPEMTGEEFRREMRAQSLRVTVLARILKRSTGQVSAWCNGHNDVPGYAVAFLQAFRHLDPATRQAFRAAGGAYRKRTKKRSNDVSETRAGA